MHVQFAFLLAVFAALVLNAASTADDHVVKVAAPAGQAGAPGPMAATIRIPDPVPVPTVQPPPAIVVDLK